MTSNLEPKEAFPYMPPTDEVRLKYQHIFELDASLPPRFFKVLFDKFYPFVFNFMPGFILLPLIPFHFFKSPTETPGNFFAMVNKESPLLTT